MFNPHIHQQQQQQFHQHLRQLQQLFQQQPPPQPPPPGHHVAHHHHQTPRPIPVPPQTAPPPRMVNLCQTTQTTIIAPNPMLQGAILMQQMQGNMRGFGMGGQQFRQFFAAGTRSSLLGPVPMGMAIKSPIMGFPAARPFHPHARYYNNNNTTTTTATSTAPSSSSSSTTMDTIAHQPDKKQDSEQLARGSTEDQQSANSTSEPNNKFETVVAVEGKDGPTQICEEQLEEPAVKKRRTEGSEIVTTVDAQAEVLSAECNSNTEESQHDDCILLEGGSSVESDAEMLEESGADEVQSCLFTTSPSGRANEDDQQVNLLIEEMPQEGDKSLDSPGNHNEGEEGVTEGTNKFYCYLCSITCHNQQNFRSHMNSISHQQRMMEIQHMSNACLVTLLPRVQETLQGANKDGEKKADLEKKRWCATCHTHFSSSIMEHRRTGKHKLASRTAISSCMVCKKHFRNSQIFVEHLQSQEHQQKMDKLQEEDGCVALAKLTALDTDGILLEEEEGSEGEEEQERRINDEDEDSSEKRDDWSSLKEVTLKNMGSDEQYDPDTVYGSSFFVPVAGFICRLCKKFYHFESSALHTHCKSLTHFENLKRYRILLSQNGEDVKSSSKESLLATDSLRHVTESPTDGSEDNSCDTGSVAGQNAELRNITLTQQKTHRKNQQHEKETEPDPTVYRFLTPTATCTDLSLHSNVEESTPTTPQETAAGLPAGIRGEPDSELTTTVEYANENDEEDEEDEEKEEEEEEEEASVVPVKKNSTGKAKAAPKRRSGRATNRR